MIQPNITSTKLDPPVLGVSHASRAWATVIATIGILVESLQHSAPEIQRLFPDVKWVAPAITLIGFVWLSFQRVGDATRQAKE